MDSHNLLRVKAPLYAAISAQVCWQCNVGQSVVALMSRDVRWDDEDALEDDEPYLLLTVTQMPLEVLKALQLLNHRFQLAHSRTRNLDYYANHCECGALLGDHFLHSEPGGAFFPDSETDFEKIIVVKLPCSGTLLFHGEWSQGVGGDILKMAKRKRWKSQS